MMKKLAVLAVAFMLSACASNLPKTISESPVTTASVAEARVNIGSVTGREVRWGGKVAAVKNFADSSEIEIVSRALYKSGRPKNTDHSDGRFIAIVAEFIDPNVYKKDRQVTVHGTISGSRNDKIGEYDYFYPVVKADALHLWEPIRENNYPYPPYLYDPWFYPWYYHPGYGLRGQNFIYGHSVFSAQE